MRAKIFKYWITQELHEQFGLERVEPTLLLNNWLASDGEISIEETNRLNALRGQLRENVDYWNEEELKMKFIGQILDLVNIDSKNFRTFYDRTITVEVKGVKLNGKLDMLVATGFQVPKKPFFCVHEYKQETKRDGDPKGQLLVEMVALQALNQNEDPIYGCYVLGENWHFVVLENNEYCISVAFRATQDDVFAIFKMLRKIKEYIVELTK
jgi:hypothetical protein